MDKTPLVALLLVAMALAGCADDGGSGPDADEETLADQDLEATDTTGVIRGVVVDPAIVPIEGAKVKVRSLDLEAETTEDGSFGFSELEPGTYFLDVSKIGFNPVQSSAVVEAGVEKPPVVRIQLETNPSAIPYSETTQWTGHLRCGAAAVVTAFPCSVVRGTEDIVEDYNSHVMEFDELPDFIQSELYWDNTQPLGESLFFNYAHCCNNAGFAANGTVQGPSPLTVNAVKREMEGADILEDGLEIRVYGGAFPGTEGVGYGVGVQVEQPIESFTTTFYNYKPPEGWTYIGDGPFAPPQ